MALWGSVKESNDNHPSPVTFNVKRVDGKISLVTPERIWYSADPDIGMLPYKER